MSLGRVVLLKSAVATVLSVAASLFLAVTIVPALGGVVDGNAWLMCVLCPLFIAFPVSAWQFRQTERLRAAHREVARLHEQLARTHGALTAAHEELKERARRDGMTGLLNRESFFAALAQAMAADPSGVLLAVDADHFKTINDRFGHPVGDAALRAIGGAIAGTVGEGGLCGRIGGEEFAIYLAGSDLAGAAQVAERIRMAVARLRIEAESGAPVALSVSIGGASRRGMATVTALVAEADRQLYRAKRRGRDRVVLAPQAKAAA